MAEKKSDQIKSKFYTLLMVVFAFSIGLFFWKVIRNNILVSSCSEIAINSTHLQSRTSLFVDTSSSYELNLNDCMKEVGLNP